MTNCYSNGAVRGTARDIYEWHWAGLFRPCLCLVALATMLVGCDTGTMDFGSVDNVGNVVPEEDQIVTSTAVYMAYSRTDSLGAVRTHSRKCYFGEVTDPETHATMRSEYVAQLHCFEGENFPHVDSLCNLTADGLAQCDSVELLMYYDTWYGDRLAPLKVSVYELSKDNILPGDSVFYTDVDLDNFVHYPMEALATKVFTAWDNTLPESELTSASHTHCTRIRLPNAFGDNVMRKYYESPSSFDNTYKFLRDVCPGFYMQLASGDGALLSVTSTSLNVYYRFQSKEGGKDTIYNAYTNFVGSPEVVQATRFVNSSLKEMVEENRWTYVKSPAGLYTDMELPVNEIVKGHEMDSLARVQITMMRYNSDINGSEHSGLVFNAPSALCMIEKSQVQTFFEKGVDYVKAARQFAVSTFTDQYNCYDYTNVARLVSYLYEKKVNGMAETGLDEAAWEEKNPDWNHVALIPVTVATNASSNTIISVTHDMSVTSARLIGGSTPINVHVTYSRYK